MLFCDTSKLRGNDSRRKKVEGLQQWVTALPVSMRTWVQIPAPVQKASVPDFI